MTRPLDIPEGLWVTLPVGLQQSLARDANRSFPSAQFNTADEKLKRLRATIRRLSTASNGMRARVIASLAEASEQDIAEHTANLPALEAAAAQIFGPLDQIQAGAEFLLMDIDSRQR